ncbi:hypothetical protein THERMOT_464 [Bathymodiolus thermophilus thioautotrophic gill symbiont]|uniref:adenylate kinase n=1 Tax=Bathymodiolus thermophilus thioautotrophic gill symbiont TaxID=2360 RepID=UPI00192C19E9|nr:adenylate kinase [Bathymodiolus thermophilus thioautotrophic gill symbiont]CAB5496163.1 hypothetical protein THERMOT_464 [Bathymodiolus thermophilus thioautotrophic gill symbiont]
MKKIAVFGKSGGGKSVFSKKLSLATGIPLFPLDLIEYSKGGEKVSKDEYLQKYHDILNTEFWIIEGFGTMETFIKRLQEADTLIYINLPMRIHYWRVTKRLLLSPFTKPEGWPDKSPMIRSTYNCYVHLFGVAPKFWNANFLKRLESMSQEKTVHHLSSTKELNKFIEQSMQPEAKK